MIYSTPTPLTTAGSNHATVQINLANTARSYTKQCSAYASSWGLPTFFYGSQAYSCKVPEGAGKVTSTSFTFSTGDGKIELNYT
jgi:hypothetical protein